jgi:hypothetical protein
MLFADKNESEIKIPQVASTTNTDGSTITILCEQDMCAVRVIERIDIAPAEVSKAFAVLKTHAYASVVSPLPGVRAVVPAERSDQRGGEVMKIRFLEPVYYAGTKYEIDEAYELSAADAKGLAGSGQPVAEDAQVAAPKEAKPKKEVKLAVPEEPEHKDVTAAPVDKMMSEAPEKK